MINRKAKLKERRLPPPRRILNEFVQKIIRYLPLLTLAIIGCGKDSEAGGEDGFDRSAMLINWADNIIIPAYEAYADSLDVLKRSAASFTSSPGTENLSLLRTAWLNAYIAWQRVSMFEIGRAEELALRNYTNVFPVNAADMEMTIRSGAFDLGSVNRQDEQGFPALDYLINGLGESDGEIVAVYLQEPTASNYSDYLTAVAERLNNMAVEVFNDWKNNYRDSFVSNDGSQATSSVNELVNNILFYYERHLRAGKIGIPAGVFSPMPLPDRVEAIYSKGSSKILFNAALDAFQDFFNGDHFDGTGSGKSLAEYLNFFDAVKKNGDEKLSEAINLQFDASRTAAAKLKDDLQAQVFEDHSLMNAVYDELQKNVVNMKVDMLSVLSIRVNYVDADGD